MEAEVQTNERHVSQQRKNWQRNRAGETMENNQLSMSDDIARLESGLEDLRALVAAKAATEEEEDKEWGEEHMHAVAATGAKRRSHRDIDLKEEEDEEESQKEEQEQSEGEPADYDRED